MNVFANANGTELMFWGTAMFGTIFFVLRMVLMIVGGFGSDINEGDIDTDSGSENVVSHSAELEGTDTAFKLMSLNSITGFFMMFGWAGLSAYKQFQLNAVISFIIAFFTGLLAMFITAFLFKLAMKLNTPGYRFNINKTIGLEGDVYLRIPSDGRGKVRVTLNGVSKIIEAVSEEKEEIDSFKNICIVRVVGHNIVAVKKSKN